MLITWRNLFPACLAAALLAGCAAKGPKETTPVVTVLPNASGIEAGPAKAGATRDGADFMYMTNIPPGVALPVKGIIPPGRKEPYHFIPAEGALQVLSVERPGYFVWDATLRDWKTLLGTDWAGDREARSHFSAALEEIPRFNAARMIVAKFRLRTFPWGRAVMFVTYYVNSITEGPVSNDMLSLTVQGITHDGRYAVNCRFAIRHPALPDPWGGGVITKGKKYFEIEKGDPGKIERWLDAQPDDSFDLKFAQYEAFLQALQIKPPGGR